MDRFTELLLNVSAAVSGPMLFLLVLVGLYLSITLKGVQFRYLPYALKLVFTPKKKLAHGREAQGDIPAFQSLMTALAGSIGVGNITGIATAVAVGGLGSLFWMWVIALLGMATAYSETLLSIKYREVNKKGAMAGGPMYTLANGLNAKRLAIIFAFLGAVSALGIGCMVQSNSVAYAVNALFPVPNWITGLTMATLTGIVVLGGIGSIGRVAGVLVPFMACTYLGMGLYVLACHWQSLGDAFIQIVSSAFTGHAATGGFMGASAGLALQMGIARGVFSNEAGLGSLAIAAASAKTDHPAEQGMLAISGVFISTFLVCTITGLVLAVTNVLPQGLTGSHMALEAFGSVMPIFRYMVFAGLILFAFTTVLAWAYYGEKCCEYLLGLKWAYRYRWLFVAMVALGAVLKLDLVWGIADLANGFMIIPHLYSLVALAHVVKQETKHYLQDRFSLVAISAPVIFHSLH